MLIAMPVWDTKENGRSKYTEQSLEALMNTITVHDSVIVSDNGSCDKNRLIYAAFERNYSNFAVIYNGRNLGIAGGVNVAWKTAAPGSVLCKIDNDCIIKTNGWTEQVQFVFERMPTVGILGLKRKDLPEQPEAEQPFYKTKLIMVDHVPGENWLVIEQSQHVMGTCYCFNPSMLPKFGYLQQPNIDYGFDDALAAVRAYTLGFTVNFLLGVEIDHIDNGDDKVYMDWKKRQAAIGMLNYNRFAQEIRGGKRSPYYDGG